VDGRSLAPLLDRDPPDEENWRSAFLVEAASELVPPAAVPPLSGDRLPEDWWRAPREDRGRPGLEALRSGDHLYVEYDTGERELYDLKKDPYQLENIYEVAPDKLARRFEAELAVLRRCQAEGCRTAEGGD
jgi:hypothetical protein